MSDLIFPGQMPEMDLGKAQLPSNVDLVLWQGDAQRFGITAARSDGTPVDLTGLTPSAVLRKSFADPTLVHFVCTITDPAAGEISLYLDSATSKALTAGGYVWSLHFTNTNGDVSTLMAGDVTVYAEVDD